MSDRPDRASGLLVYRTRRDIDVDELTKIIGMIRGVVRVVVLDARRLMVVFETQQRTSEGEYGPAIKTAVESMVESDVKVDWLEESFSSHEAVSKLRREAFDALLDLAKRVYATNGFTGTGEEAVEARFRNQFTGMIEDLAREILSPKKPAAT